MNSEYVDAFSRLLLQNRIVFLLASLIVVLFITAGAKNLFFDTDYRVFFGANNPQLLEFEALQKTYTKVDNINFAFDPIDGTATDSNVLLAIEDLTAKAWELPYSQRVDSISNFQYTEVDGDDLIVRNLYEGGDTLDSDQKKLVELVGSKEPVLAGKLHDPSHRSSGVNVTIRLPGDHSEEVLEVASAARKLAAEIEEKYSVKIHLGGVIMLNHAFQEASMKDLATLVPAMYFVIMIISFVLLRSFAATFAILVVIIPSILVAMGFAGWLGVGLTPPSASAPTIIMTLAVADSIHILVTMLNKMKAGMEKNEALAYSLRVNMKPVFLTSITTALGFLCLNFSDAPPFGDLGNLTAVGVMAAWFFSVTFLPILISFLPVKAANNVYLMDSMMTKVGTAVVKNSKQILIFGALISLSICALVPLNEINDDFVKYFDETVGFRQDSDWISDNLTGANQVQFSLPANGANGVSDIEFINKVEKFTEWARDNSRVTHVLSISDTFKRLNRDLNAGDPALYKIPEARELAAQYLLLYELSLPFGLDLNNQLDIDKSSTQVVVTIEDMTTNELRAWVAGAEKYLQKEVGFDVTGVGPTIMFAYIAERNVKSMLTGTAIAIVLISALILIALRDLRLGLISLVPNILPAVMAFGCWGLLVGQVNMAIAIVSSMVLGIVVDDCVHFLTKYQVARQETGASPRQAVVEAFSSVGTALLVTTVILAIGFIILAQSSFAVNSYSASLTAIAIVIALIADLTILPALLIYLDRDERQSVDYPNSSQEMIS